MASFDGAIPATLKWEGGYANDPRDPGGETMCGISRKFWPAWEGWADVDAASPKNSLLTNEVFMSKVASFYREKFWSPELAQLDQVIANKVFDLGVNVGVRQAAELLQKAIVTCGLLIAVDGDLGPKTVAAANSIHPDDLLDEVKREAAYYYNNLVRLKPQLAKFLASWLKRADS